MTTKPRITVTNKIKTYYNAAAALDYNNTDEIILPGRGTKLKRISSRAIAINYRGTNIVTMDADGSYLLNSNGWLSQSTRLKINTYLPSHLHIEVAPKGIWLVRNSATGSWAVYKDYFTIDSNGVIVNNSVSALDDLAIIERINRYLDLYMSHVEDGSLSDQDSASWLEVSPEEAATRIGFLEIERAFKLVRSEKYPPELLRRAMMMFSNKPYYMDMMEDVCSLGRSYWRQTDDQKLKDGMQHFRRALKRLIHRSLELPL